jgi:TolB-like protein
MLAVSLFSQSKDRIAVLDFETSSLSKSEMLVFIDYIATQIAQVDTYSLIDRRQRSNILDELSFSYSGCTDQECQLEIGRLLSANFIVVGSLGAIGSIYILNMHLIDVETSETISTVSKQYENLDSLLKNSNNLVATLLNEKPPISVISEDIQDKDSPIIKDKSTEISVPHVIAPILGISNGYYVYDDVKYDFYSKASIVEKAIPYLPDNSKTQDIFNGVTYNAEMFNGFYYGGLLMMVLSAGATTVYCVASDTIDPTIAGTGLLAAGVGVVSIIVGLVFGFQLDEEFSKFYKYYNFIN